MSKSKSAQRPNQTATNLKLGDFFSAKLNGIKSFRPQNPLPKINAFFATQEQIWLSFLIPFAVMAGAYIYFQVFPFGERSVLSLDLNAQYVFYFQYMKDALFGAEDILYSWSRNLSGEFVGIIGYYLFSPFNLLVWVFPVSHITEGLLLMILTKIGFIGVTMAVYLGIHRGFSKHTTVIFSTLYALLSYNIVQTMNPMWLDGVMALPLVVMGIESLMKKGRYKLLIFSLFYSFVTCFYIGYMVAIFAVLYFIYYTLTSRKLNDKDSLILIAKRAGLFACSAIIAGMLAAFLLLPVYSALSMGKFTFSTPDYSIRSNFNILEMTRKLFVNSYDTVRMDGMPFVYAGTLALILLPAYFLCDKIRRARRFAGIVFMALFVYSMIITPLDMFWHGGQNPNWLPYRYSFMLCFLILAFTAEAFQHIRKIPRKVIGGSAVVAGMLLVYWESLDTVNPDLGNGREVFDWFGTVFPSMLAVLLFAGILIVGRDKLTKHNVVSASLVALVALELFFNAQNSLEKQNEDIVYSTRESFNGPFIPTRKVTEKIHREDKTLFRMEKTYIRSACDPMALRMNGITHSSSMLNDRSIAFLKSMGYSSRSHASRYSGHTPLTDDLLGFKYVLSCVDDNYRNIKKPSDITVTANPDVMPIAYLVDTKMKTFSYPKPELEDDVFINQNKMLSYMLGEEYNEYFVKMAIEDKRPQNVNESTWGDNYFHYTKGDEPIDSHIQYDVTADEDGDFYMYFPTPHEYKCNVWIATYDANGEETGAGVFKGEMYTQDNYYIHYLGNFKKGEKFMMTLSLTSDIDRVYFREENIMRLDQGRLEADIARLHQINENTKFEAVSNRHLKITTNNPEERLLFTSIPVEPGWTAKLNGKTVPIEEIIEVKTGEEEQEDGSKADIMKNALMAITVPPGENVIELKFFPNYMPLGIFLSIAGIGGFILLYLFMSYMTERSKLKSPSDGGAPSPIELLKTTDDYEGVDSDYKDDDKELADSGGSDKTEDNSINNE